MEECAGLKNRGGGQHDRGNQTDDVHTESFGEQRKVKERTGIEECVAFSHRERRGKMQLLKVIDYGIRFSYICSRKSIVRWADNFGA
jgi:hypothetical protein